MTGELFLTYLEKVFRSDSQKIVLPMCEDGQKRILLLDEFRAYRYQPAAELMASHNIIAMFIPRKGIMFTLSWIHGAAATSRLGHYKASERQAEGSA